MSILSDTYLTNINNNILNKYSDILGSKAAIVDIKSSPPYYQITYQVDNSNYSFLLLYDYLQDKVVRANITTNKLTNNTSTINKSVSVTTTNSTGSTQTNMQSSTSSLSTLSSNSTLSSSSNSITSSSSTPSPSLTNKQSS